MTRAAREAVRHPIEKLDAGAPDWALLYPADPELMVSAEGDASGLAELKRDAEARIRRAGFG